MSKTVLYHLCVAMSENINFIKFSWTQQFYAEGKKIIFYEVYALT